MSRPSTIPPGAPVETAPAEPSLVTEIPPESPPDEPLYDATCDPHATGDSSQPYGVPGAWVLRPFKGANDHKGIDVGQSRGTPVFVNLRLSIPVAELNNVSRTTSTPDADYIGLELEGEGDADLVDAQVFVQPWSPSKTKVRTDYGGVVGLATHYRYQDSVGQARLFTIYVEYLHLITPAYLPRREDGAFIDRSGHAIRRDEYEGCTGFGALMQHGRVLTPDELRTKPLVGFLGAMRASHIHVQAAFGKGIAGYLRGDFIDPAVLFEAP